MAVFRKFDLTMTLMPAFPAEIHRYVRSVFASFNRRIGEKIARVPNCAEPSLDTTFIEHLSHFSPARVVAPGWAVRIDVHQLGGMRHFHGWEIADIGVLVFARQGAATAAKKVALLQAKRLYPVNHGVIHEAPEDYLIGFGSLLPSQASPMSLSKTHTYQFSDQSRYRALHSHDDQYKTIERYETEHRIPVHYLFYNPWLVPTSYTVPPTAPVRISRKANGGCRIVPAAQLRNALQSKPANYSPSFADMAGILSRSVQHLHGWRLEHFIADLVMKCKEGHLFEDLSEENVFALFNRRSGPIAAAVAVTVEQFGD